MAVPNIYEAFLILAANTFLLWMTQKKVAIFVLQSTAWFDTDQISKKQKGQ